MLVVKDLVKNFEDKQIGPFNLELGTNETLAVIGRSGSGKSTLVRMITEVIKPDFGSVLFNDKSLRKGDFTYISQIGTLFNHLTIKENLYLTYDKNINKVYKVLEEVGLDKSYLAKYPFELSGGEKQRIDLTRAILSENKIMILDEAFSALDTSTKDDIYKVLKNLRNTHELLIIFITHDLDEALFLGDKIMVIEEGKVIFNDVYTKLLTSIDKKEVSTFISNERLQRLKKAYLRG